MAIVGLTRWGIIGAGKISHDWAVGASTLPASEHQVLGVAARDVNSAKAFATEHDIPRVYNSYEDLLKDSEIDVVYIGTLHTTHLILGKLALDYGKHVLCEKPLCMNLRETKELFEYARIKKRFVMEALWSRFFPAYQKLKEELEKGTIGEVLQVIANMGISFPEDDWRRNKAVGGGTTLDMGVYTIGFTSLVFKGLKPVKIVASGHLNSTGADDSASATIIYPEGKTATSLTHTKVNLPCTATAVGTKGSITLHYPLWAATKIETPDGIFEFDLPKSDKRINYWNSTGLSYQCHEVRRCIQNGLLESPQVTWDESILMAEIRQDIRQQIGVSYPQDSQN